MDNNTIMQVSKGRYIKAKFTELNCKLDVQKSYGFLPKWREEIFISEKKGQDCTHRVSGAI